MKLRRHHRARHRSAAMAEPGPALPAVAADLVAFAPAAAPSLARQQFDGRACARKRENDDQIGELYYAYYDTSTSSPWFLSTSISAQVLEYELANGDTDRAEVIGDSLLAWQYDGSGTVADRLRGAFPSADRPRRHDRRVRGALPLRLGRQPGRVRGAARSLRRHAAAPLPRRGDASRDLAPRRDGARRALRRVARAARRADEVGDRRGQLRQPDRGRQHAVLAADAEAAVGAHRRSVVRGARGHRVRVPEPGPVRRRRDLRPLRSQLSAAGVLARQLHPVRARRRRRG